VFPSFFSLRVVSMGSKNPTPRGMYRLRYEFGFQ
jgi:hypothetical protein